MASVQCRREPGLLAVDRGAGEHAGLHGFVEHGMNAGQGFPGLVFFPRGDEGAGIFFHAAQVGFDAAVVLVLAFVPAHAAFG